MSRSIGLSLQMMGVVMSANMSQPSVMHEAAPPKDLDRTDESIGETVHGLGCA